MRAWTIEGDRLTPVDRPAADPTADEVAIEVEGAFIASWPSRPGRVPGGAAVGTVQRAGDAAGHLVGSRVLVADRSPCGECDLCRRGAAPVCPRGAILGDTVDGAMAEQLIARARWVCPLVEGLEIEGPAAAAAAGPVLAAYAMYARTGVAPGEPVIIAGDQVASRALFWITISRGGKPIAITGDASWAATVRDRGGAVVEPGADLLARTRAAAAGAGLGERPWRLFDADGNSASRAVALELASAGASLTLARGRDGGSVDLDRLVDRGVTIVGVPGAHPDLLAETAALVVRGDVPLADLVDLRPATELDRLPAPGPRAVVAAI